MDLWCAGHVLKTRGFERGRQEKNGVSAVINKKYVAVAQSHFSLQRRCIRARG